MKTRLSRPALLITGLAALAALTFTGAAAVARLNMFAPPTSPVIATVDLESIVSGLNERKDKEDALKASLADAQKKVDKLVEDVKNEQTKVEAMPAGADKDKALKNLREMAIRAEFEKQYAQKLLIELQGEMLKDLFTKISDAVRRESRTKKYSLVMTSDEKIEVPKSDPETITRVIASKRMLYVDAPLDITNDIVTMMNSEYATRKGG